MKKIFLSAIVLTILFCSSCKKEEVNFVLSFQLKHGNSEMAIAEEFDDNVGIRQKASLLKFYISDLELISKNGEYVKVSDYNLIELADAGQSSYDLALTVTEGEYVGLRFALGLNENQRSTDPTSVPLTDALSDAQDMYWAMGDGTYIFTKYEGVLDQDTDGVFETAQIYHIADYSYYRMVEVSGASFKFKKNQDNRLSLSIDHDKIFSPGGASNIDQINENYSQSVDAISERFANNMQQAFSY